MTINNFQKYRHIQAPKLKWTWAKKETILNITGAQIKEQGNCSIFKGIVIPQYCKKNPTVVPILPWKNYDKKIANCCKGGVISSWGQNHETAITSFQLSVGSAGTNNRTVVIPKNFSLGAVGNGYACGSTKIVKPTRFVTPDGRRFTQAMSKFPLSYILTNLSNLSFSVISI